MSLTRMYYNESKGVMY